MSKMKHLLRKLHIGGGGLNDQHQRLAETRPVSTPISNQTPSTASTPSTSSSGTMVGRIGVVDSSPADRTAADGGSGSGSGSGRGGGGGGGGGECVDFNFLEEEFQVQLALAISASDPDSRDDPESAQIDAAKRISLGCSAAVSDNKGRVDILSLHYWSYNVVNYTEKVVDGFYDVYTVSSNSLAQGRMPLLVDLQVLSVSDDVDYEVILVNRMVDSELRQLEKRAYDISLECRVSDHGLIFSGLIQKIADIVVDRMGGPVGDADDMTRKWNMRRNLLRNSLNTIILPLGRLDFGLSRHRALLFKVLADRINLPCMLVKGSYYTGTDDGAVNLVKVEDGSEYIIDLMGAPGTLIPAEVPSSQLPSSFLDIRSLADVTVLPTGLRMLHDEGVETPLSKDGSSRSDEALFLDTQASDDARRLEENQNERCENEFAKYFPSPHRSGQSSVVSGGKASSAQKKRVKNVSKYVISAAKDPEFAQKLHAVLLESGATPPPDLFSDIPQDVDEDRMGDQRIAADGVQYHQDNLFSYQEQSLIPISERDCSSYINSDIAQKQAAEGFAQKQNELDIMSKLSLTSDATDQGYMVAANSIGEPIQTDSLSVAMVPVNPPRHYPSALLEEQINEPAFPFEANSFRRHVDNAYFSDRKKFFRDAVKFDLGKESAAKMMETATSRLGIGSDGESERINAVLGESPEWEIQWEDLRIGERIGIGSYGEVYHGDWNGTEVAVKKFLNQDFSGEALLQFRSEVEIMLRLRHPNVVLFMGAVTRSPNFSILTEFLPRGSLFKLLHRPNPQLDEKRRMKMALDVAKGMNYLHTSHPTIVHRDLKSPNLLVDKNWVVKVCDFGLSRMKHHTFLSSKSTAGTPEWMAPEVLRNEPANEKCDVYSFGVILWELTTACIPWKGLNPMQVVGAVGFQNRRLEIPEEVDPELAQIIRDCWERDPNLRPSFAELMVRLRRLQHLVERKNSTK
ncbi:probable serine/threonine-protein kinase SIS8 isoform X2 [Humulus lupulus]|uniref:probable serine/threonine-protein kinase SIS8 isoform X2 n=1 Tax=Humulus lupulus TaxID=3486 RepID=UPI002B405F07|nr:probable serine/threonine-protein kinase SIS8 isoform X2 [Humulus lupulus]